MSITKERQRFKVLRGNEGVADGQMEGLEEGGLFLVPQVKQKISAN